LYVDSWGEKASKNTETGSIEIVDEYQGEDVMEEKEEEKYLGDVLSKDGRNLKNIQARVNKGKGIVKKILINWMEFHLESYISKLQSYCAIVCL
jgi:hypothetical protein